MSPIEKREFEEFIQKNPEFKKLAENIKKVDSILPSLFLKKQAPLPNGVFRNTTERRSILPFIASAAVISIIFALSSTLYFLKIKKNNTYQISKSKSEQKMFTKALRLKAPGASYVSVVGDFNSWNPDANPMEDLTGEGEWYTEINLPEGVYSYQFLVDGKIIIPDFNADTIMADGYSGSSSIALVSQE